MKLRNWDWLAVALFLSFSGLILNGFYQVLA